MSKKDIRVLEISGFSLLILLIILYLLKFIDVAQAIEIILTFALVIVTAVYVRRTAEIAKATREQADASSRPYLLLRLTDELVTWPPPNNEISVVIRNEGLGPAINIEASLWHPKTIYPYDSRGYLASGEEWQLNLSTSDVGVPYEGEENVRPWLPQLKDIIKEQKTGAIVVRYHDINNRKWLSYLSLELRDDLPIVFDGEQNILEWKKHD